MAYTEGDLKKDLENKDYEFGFVTDIESEKAPKGLNKEIIQFISQKKKEPDWLLAYRLKAFEVWSKIKLNFLNALVFLICLLCLLSLPSSPK